jgi:RimJ/RimL family protein N-acetyltransferase
MNYYKKLVGEKCYLSPCHPEDAEQWTAWFNDMEVALPLGDEVYTPFSLGKSQEIVQSIIKQQQHIFSIVDNDKDILIGRCLLFGIDSVNRNAMLGIVIGEKEYWSRGYGQDATRLLLEYAFNMLNLNSVMLGVMEFNQRAIHCYQKVGFREIGRRRQTRIIGERKFDVILMDIVAEDFQSNYMDRYFEP